MAVCSPPAAAATAITIRPFGGRAFTIEELTASGSLPAPVLEAAAGVLQTERNVLLSGGTDSGKTTLLNALVALLPAAGRVISIEDTLELRLRRANCLRFRTRGLAGRNVTIRGSVRHALRHRPDHIVVGEVRGAEAADLLQALKTGHGGSLATVHANNAEAALSRLATCAMQASDALGDRHVDAVARGDEDGRRFGECLAALENRLLRTCAMRARSAITRGIDLLIAPHHGRKSGRSYEFLDTLKPTLTFFGKDTARN